jgi:hypothetical protein
LPVTSTPASTFFVSAAAVSAVQPSKHGPAGSEELGKVIEYAVS